MMQKLLNLINITKENIKEHNPNWPQFPDQPYKILRVRSSGSGKRNLLFNVINKQPDTEKKISVLNVSYEAKY